MKLRVLVVLSALSTAACSKPLTDNECVELLDRYTEFQIEQARPSTGGAERVELKQEARRKAAMDPEFAACSGRVSRSQFECAMAANNADQIERCLL